MCYVFDDRVFTGDTVLIGGCGRTDFQSGSAKTLWNSIQRVLQLNPETLIYPAHNYKGQRVSSVEQELLSNPRVSGKTEEEFIEIMNNLGLPNPKLIDIAVPANLKSGNV
jgi:sulfur dioxygenase